MRRLFEKNEPFFAFLGIVLYMMLNMLGTLLSQAANVGELPRAVLLFSAALLLPLLLIRRGLKDRYGLCRPERSFRPIWFIPLCVLPASNLFYGFSLPQAFSEILYAVILAVSVAVLEELLFRGFLYQSLKFKSVEAAAVISSVVFGLLHLVRLLDGASVSFVLCQSALSVAVGYLLAALFEKSKSLLPCIALHAAFNLCGAFASGASVLRLCILTAAQILLSVFCTVYVRRMP